MLWMRSSLFDIRNTADVPEGVEVGDVFHDRVPVDAKVICQDGAESAAYGLRLGFLGCQSLRELFTGNDALFNKEVTASPF